MQSQLSVKTDDDPCDDVALAPDVAHVVPSEEELTSVLHQAARHRLDAPLSVVPEVATVPTVQQADTIVRPVLPRDMLTSEDRISHHIAPPVDAMVHPAPANDVGQPADRRRKGGPVGRALLALLSTLIIGLGAATWKSYGDGASKIVAGLVTQPVVASSQPAQPDKPQSDKQEVAVQPAAAAASDQPVPAAQPAPAAQPVSAATASPDQTQQLQSMARDLAALGQQVSDLKAELAQVKASQQQAAHSPATVAAPTSRAKTSVPPPRPIAAQTRRQIPPTQSFAPPQAAAAQPAVPQVATAPYRSAPQVAAAPAPANPYYAPPQRYAPPPEMPPQATAEPIDQEYWAPRPPMPVR